MIHQQIHSGHNEFYTKLKFNLDSKGNNGKRMYDSLNNLYQKVLDTINFILSNSSEFKDTYSKATYSN